MKLLATLTMILYFTACALLRAPAVACQVREATVLQDIPGHTPDMPAQQYVIEAETVLPIVERVSVEGDEWMRVEYGLEVTGYLPAEVCRVVSE